MLKRFSYAHSPWWFLYLKFPYGRWGLSLICPHRRNTQAHLSPSLGVLPFPLQSHPPPHCHFSRLAQCISHFTVRTLRLFKFYTSLFSTSHQRPIRISFTPAVVVVAAVHPKPKPCPPPPPPSSSPAHKRTLSPDFKPVGPLAFGVRPLGLPPCFSNFIFSLPSPPPRSRPAPSPAFLSTNPAPSLRRRGV